MILVYICRLHFCRKYPIWWCNPRAILYFNLSSRPMHGQTWWLSCASYYFHIPGTFLSCKESSWLWHPRLADSFPPCPVFLLHLAFLLCLNFLFLLLYSVVWIYFILGLTFSMPRMSCIYTRCLLCPKYLSWLGYTLPFFIVLIFFNILALLKPFHTTLKNTSDRYILGVCVY